MQTTEETLGAKIDRRGLKFNLQDGDFVEDIIVIAEIVTETGARCLTVVSDDGTNWIKEVGMLHMATQQVQGVV